MVCYIIYMDGVNDIHLRPDSMIYIRGEGGRGSLYTSSALWGGETLYSDTCASCSHLLTPGNSDRATGDIFKSRCLMCRIDGDEFSPVSWLVWCGQSAAVADLDRVVQLWWLRYEVW